MCVCVSVTNWSLLIAGTTPPQHHATILDGRGGEGTVRSCMCVMCLPPPTGIDKAVLVSPPPPPPPPPPPLPCPSYLVPSQLHSCEAGACGATGVRLHAPQGRL